MATPTKGNKQQTEWSSTARKKQQELDRQKREKYMDQRDRRERERHEKQWQTLQKSDKEKNEHVKHQKQYINKQNKEKFEREKAEREEHQRLLAENHKQQRLRVERYNRQINQKLRLNHEHEQKEKNQREKAERYRQNKEREQRQRWERERLQKEMRERQKVRHQRLQRQKQRFEREKEQNERRQRIKNENNRQEVHSISGQGCQWNKKTQNAQGLIDKQKVGTFQQQVEKKEFRQRSHTGYDSIQKNKQAEIFRKNPYLWQHKEQLRQQQDNFQKDHLQRERRQRISQAKPPLYGRNTYQNYSLSIDRSTYAERSVDRNISSEQERQRVGHFDKHGGVYLDKQQFNRRHRPRSAIKGLDFDKKDDTTPHIYVNNFDNSSVKSLVPRLNLSRVSLHDVGSVKGSTRSIRSFSSRNLAERIKLHTLQRLKTFDTNHNDMLEYNQILDALRCLLKENQLEVRYVTRNFFRYSVDKSELVKIDSFVLFFLGMHCGQMAVQRFHLKQMYSRGKELIMNEKQFIMSFQGALDFVEFLAPMNELKRLFKEIDTDMDGWISYKEYFEFLKHFFNYLPSSTIEVLKKYPELIETHTESLGHSELSDTEDQSLEQTLGLLVRNQTIALLNQYATGRAKLYQYNSLPRILKQAFNLERLDIDYCLLNFAKYDADKDNALTSDELADLIMEVYCSEIVLQRLHQQKKFIKSQQRLLGIHDFMLLIDTAFSYLSSKLRREDLISIFKSMDTCQKGFIGYNKFIEFVKDNMSSKINCDRRSQNKNTTLTTSPNGSNLGSSNVNSDDGEKNNGVRQINGPKSMFLRV